jgi:fermentation-respiration switch protein FrsA (DUF1100 family)
VGVVAAVLAVLLVLAYAGVSYAVFDGLSYAKGGCWESAAANTPDRFTVDARWGAGLADAYAMPKPQDVVFNSRDAAAANVNLAAWWIPAGGTTTAAEAPAVVVVHGVKSCRREASVLLAAGMLHKHGYSVFIMDLRNHGDSGFDADHRIAAGSDEYLDILGGWDWVRTQGVPASRIGVVGFSLGSGVALVAGGEEPAVQAVWADSSFTQMEKALGYFVKDQTGLPDIVVPGAILWGRLNAIDFVRFDPITEVGKYQGRSLAFAHGARDKVLPVAMATTMHDAAAAAGAHVADVYVVPNAGHTEEVYADPSGYEARIVAFFGQALGGPSS